VSRKNVKVQNAIASPDSGVTGTVFYTVSQKSM